VRVTVCVFSGHVLIVAKLLVPGDVRFFVDVHKLEIWVAQIHKTRENALYDGQIEKDRREKLPMRLHNDDLGTCEENIPRHSWIASNASWMKGK